MITEAIILAGGFGTRLRGVLDNIPKPMAAVAGRPFIEYILDILADTGIKTVILATGFRHEVIEDHLGDSFRGMNLLYSVEMEPLGTGGAILQALDRVKGETCFVLNGDTLFNIDFRILERESLKHRYPVFAALKQMELFDRYGKVETDGDKIVSFSEKGFCERGLINGGIYVIEKSWLKLAAHGKMFSFERDILETHVTKGVLGCAVCEGYFIDIGVPEDLVRADKELPGKIRSFPL